MSEELEILNTADMLIDSTGKEVTVQERLEDIASRYGKDSINYKLSCQIAKQVKLL